MSTEATEKPWSGGMKLDHNKDGSWVRPVSSFRDSIAPGGRFPPEKGRYYLIISRSCPWANRTSIVRNLKSLQEFIPIVVTSPYMGPNGWPFKKAADPGAPSDGVDDDPLYGAKYLKELYFKAAANYEGRFTVPVLWDTKTETIVNNESSEILRMLGSAFDELLPADKAGLDLYPKELRAEIDELNEWVYSDVNNGVYKAGFAATQSAYEAAIGPLFTALDRLEERLKGRDYLVGNRLTEADVRLFTTLIRFDSAYHGIFKCNLKSIRYNYPELNRWMKQIYWDKNSDAFRETINAGHIKAGYYLGNTSKFNPSGIVPLGPEPFIEAL